MQNSLESSFRGLTRAIMLDIIAYKPIHQKDLFRDLSRIDSLIENVGVRLFTEHLPALRKQLDSSLSNSQLVLEGPLTRAYKTGSHIPRLFRGMWAELFHDDGSLKQNIDPNFVLFFRTLLDVGNKYEMEPPKSALFAETRVFYENDVTLPPPSLLWDGDGSNMADYSFVSLIDLHGDQTDQQDLFRSHDSSDTELLATVQRVADMVAASFGTINPRELSYRHGQGAVSDNLRGREKYLPSRWSRRLDRVFPLDSVALPLSIASDYTFLHKEYADLFGNSVPSETAEHHSMSYRYDDSEMHSTLEAVPKTIKGPRLIAKEPSDHVQCQLGLMDYLYSSVRRNPYLSKSIDFRRQDYSRDLALSSSRSGEYATIDLKSASDRISCWLIERLFRRNQSLLEMLISCRTRFISLAKDKKLPKLHKLRKFSTQGSAVTFPIQSIVFATLCVGAIAPANASASTIRKLFTRVRVYGDDIIVPVDWLGTVKRLFERLYLKINTTKTHSQGYFRESCGMDAWNGYDVTVPHVLRFIGQADRKSVV